jgi:hypothetical protein
MGGYILCGYPEFPIWTSGSHIVRFSCPRHNEFTIRADPNEISIFRRNGRTGLANIPPSFYRS